MHIWSNPMISILHNIMWAIGENETHKAKGNIVDLLALVGQDAACMAIGGK